MYKIKLFPEDFVVKEVTEITPKDEGRFTYFWLKKRNYTTIRALEKIAQALHIPLKRFKFAGTKDKIAITTQLVSVEHIKKEQLEKIELKDIELTFYGYGDEPASLGRLEGNEFTITIRDLEKEQIEKIKKLENSSITLPNYFGTQRFSRDNHAIGKYMIKCDFEKAVEHIIFSNSDYNDQIQEHLKKSSRDFITALKFIPKKILTLYINAYQSYLWNRMAKLAIEKDIKTEKLPMIGFGTEYKDEKVEELAKNIMKEEDITERDFIIKQLPELSSEGAERRLYMEVKDFKVIQSSDDTITINFSLSRGQYATEVIRQLME